MKPNSSWSLREKDAAAPKANSLTGSTAGANGGAAGRGSGSLLEHRVLWFVYRSQNHHAGVAEIAAGLSLEVAAVRELARGMVRKSILRELPKSPDRPHAQFAVGPKFLQQAASLATGPDPASL